MLDNFDKHAKKIAVAALIGGAVGLTASLLLSRKSNKRGSPMNSIGKVVGHLGDVIESTRTGKTLLKEAEHKVNKQENVIVSALDLAAAGIDLWKKLKKAA